MINIPDTFTVAQVRELEKNNPQLPPFFRLNAATDYSEFVDIVHEQIDKIFREYENDANTMQMHSENAFNAGICRLLRAYGFDAAHDPNNKGHTDILIKHGKFTYIGEGKVVNGTNNNYLTKGYNQLVERYMNGTTYANSASLLIFCLAENSKAVIDNWKAHLKELDSANSNFASPIYGCCNEPTFSFFSDHLLKSTGTTVHIRHRICSLYWPHPKS